MHSKNFRCIAELTRGVATRHSKGSTRDDGGVCEKSTVSVGARVEMTRTQIRCASIGVKRQSQEIERSVRSESRSWRTGWLRPFRAEVAPERMLRVAVLVAVALLARTSSASAQVILPPMTPVGPPWNALEVFEPVPFAKLWERATIEGTAPEDMPVATRVHPGYEPVGIRSGSWMFHPGVTLGTFYDSNVFASNTTKRSDVALRVHPTLRANTLWERHAVALQADLWSAFYRENPGLDYTDASVKGRARIDLTHASAILANARVARLHEGVGSLSSPAGAVEPTPYSLASGDATYWHQFNRFTVSAGVRADTYDFGSTRAQDGTIIPQSSRDGQVYTGHGRMDYVVSPKFGVFAALEGNRREIRGTPQTPLDSEGYRALGGVNLEFSRLVSGEIGFGYSRQDFDAPGIGTIEGPTYRALLTWSPTRTIDVHFRAEQIVTQASDTDATGIRADALQVGLDYEFRRNVVLSLSSTYERDKFFGQPRRDTVYSSMAEIKYLLNRFGSMSLRHRYLNRDSNIPSFVYDKHEVGLNVTAQY